MKNFSFLTKSFGDLANYDMLPIATFLIYMCKYLKWAFSPTWLKLSLYGGLTYYELHIVSQSNKLKVDPFLYEDKTFFLMFIEFARTWLLIDKNRNRMKNITDLALQWV